MTDIPRLAPIGHVHNPHAATETPYGPALQAILSAEGFAAARREILGWPGYAPTPLHRLSGLAEADGVADIWYKDEGGRFGLGSFKALGGAYAVGRVLAREAAARSGAKTITSADLRAGRHRDLVSGLTVCARVRTPAAKALPSITLASAIRALVSASMTTLFKPLRGGCFAPGDSRAGRCRPRAPRSAAPGAGEILQQPCQGGRAVVLHQPSGALAGA